LKSKHSVQSETASTFNSEKQRYESRIGELSACKELLERQLSDEKHENKGLMMHGENLTGRIDDLESTNQHLSNEASKLTSIIEDLRQKNHHLERKHEDDIARVSSLEQDRREYTRDMEYRMKQKDALLVETIDSINSGSKSRVEPVVVHLHGNNGDSSDKPSGNERLSSECNNLRSKVLKLQRENFRLESELMNMKQVPTRHDEERTDIESIQNENNSLKTILSTMRKEMETVASNDSENEQPPLPYELVLEQQLVQCRSYLDLLLKKRDFNDGGTSRSGEVTFLRSKYQELHQTANELREENIK